MEAPAEKPAYAAMLDLTTRSPDAMGVFDVDGESKSYGRSAPFTRLRWDLAVLGEDHFEGLGVIEKSSSDAVLAYREPFGANSSSRASAGQGLALCVPRPGSALGARCAGRVAPHDLQFAASAQRSHLAPVVLARLILLRFSVPLAAYQWGTGWGSIGKRHRGNDSVNVGPQIVHDQHQLDDSPVRKFNGCIACAVRIHCVRARLIGVKSRERIRFRAWNRTAQGAGHNKVILSQVAGAVEIGRGNACAGVCGSVCMEDLTRESKGVSAFECPI